MCKRSALDKLQTKIFFGDHSNEEWMQIKKDIQKNWQIANEMEKEEFIQSGAGDLLEQILEYMD